MEPFHFGPGGSLFGVHHPPLGEAARPLGIVLCHPFGQEYMRAHRALLLLARLLARHGFHVLRFDLYGCGDSAGDFEEGTVERWKEDVGTAVGELASACALRRTCLVGLRLGATLAALVGAEQQKVERLVLWDPVLDGLTYMDEITATHREWRRGSFARLEEEHVEVLGFPLSDALRASLDSVTLHALSARPAEKVLIVESDTGQPGRSLMPLLEALGSETEHVYVEGPTVWVKGQQRFDQAIVPNEVIRRIAAWVTEGVR